MMSQKASVTVLLLYTGLTETAAGLMNSGMSPV